MQEILKVYFVPLAQVAAIAVGVLLAARLIFTHKNTLTINLVKYCQAQFQLASSVPDQLGTEISLIISVTHTHPTPPHTPTRASIFEPQVQLASSVPVQLGTEISLIICMTPTHPSRANLSNVEA